MPLSAAVLSGIVLLAQTEAIGPTDAYGSQSEPPRPAPGHWLIHAGATYRRIFDIPVYGGQAGVCGGKWTLRGGDFVCMNFSMGRTEYGLTALGGSVSYRGDWSTGPVYVGLRPGASLLSLARATGGDSMIGLGLELGALFGLAAWRGEDEQLGIEAMMKGDLYLGGADGSGTTIFWGPSLALAYRW